MADLTPEEMVNQWPFVYRGGGYWRRKDAPVGEAAEIYHGKHAMEAFAEFVAEMNSLGYCIKNENSLPDIQTPNVD